MNCNSKKLSDSKNSCLLVVGQQRVEALHLPDDELVEPVGGHVLGLLVGSILPILGMRVVPAFGRHEKTFGAIT